MMKRWIPVVIAAAAIALAGCNRQESSTEVETPETETTAAGALDTAPDGTEGTPEAPPTQVDVPSDPAAAPPAEVGSPDLNTAQTVGNEVTLPSGTKFVEVEIGTGAEAARGQQVAVHYTGTLTDGTKFDSSHDRNDPIVFTLGAGEVITGWDDGIAGMKVGGKRKLTIPPDQAYGSRARGPIPANSTLLFDVELVDVK